MILMVAVDDNNLKSMLYKEEWDDHPTEAATSSCSLSSSASASEHHTLQEVGEYNWDDKRRSQFEDSIMVNSSKASSASSKDLSAWAVMKKAVMKKVKKRIKTNYHSNFINFLFLIILPLLIITSAMFSNYDITGIILDRVVVKNLLSSCVFFNQLLQLILLCNLGTAALIAILTRSTIKNSCYSSCSKGNLKKMTMLPRSFVGLMLLSLCSTIYSNIISSVTFSSMNLISSEISVDSYADPSFQHQVQHDKIAPRGTLINTSTATANIGMHFFVGVAAQTTAASTAATTTTTANAVIVEYSAEPVNVVPVEEPKEQKPGETGDVDQKTMINLAAIGIFVALALNILCCIVVYSQHQKNKKLKKEMETKGKEGGKIKKPRAYRKTSTVDNVEGVASASIIGSSQENLKILVADDGTKGSPPGEAARGFAEKQRSINTAEVKKIQRGAGVSTDDLEVDVEQVSLEMAKVKKDDGTTAAATSSPQDNIEQSASATSSPSNAKMRPNNSVANARKQLGGKWGGPLRHSGVRKMEVDGKDSVVGGVSPGGASATGGNLLATNNKSDNNAKFHSPEQEHATPVSSPGDDVRLMLDKKSKPADTPGDGDISASKQSFKSAKSDTDNAVI